MSKEKKITDEKKSQRRVAARPAGMNSNEGKDDEVESSSRTTSHSSSRYVYELNRHDVLLGRGPPSFNFEGNFRFREVVDRRRDEYRSTDSTQQKNKIAREIVEEVRNRGGRFVRRIKDEDELERLGITSEGKNDDSNNEAKVWKIVDTAEAMDKVKHTLRAGGTSSKKREQKSTQNTSNLSSLVSNLPASATAASNDSNQAGGTENVSPSDNATNLTQQLQTERERNRQLTAQLSERDNQIRILELQLSRFLGEQRQIGAGGIGDLSTLRNTRGPNIESNTTGQQGLGLLLSQYHRQQQESVSDRQDAASNQASLPPQQPMRSSINPFENLLNMHLQQQQQQQQRQFTSSSLGSTIQGRILLEQYQRSNLNQNVNQLLLESLRTSGNIATALSQSVTGSTNRAGTAQQALPQNLQPFNSSQGSTAAGIADASGDARDSRRNRPEESYLASVAHLEAKQDDRSTSSRSSRESNNSQALKRRRFE